MPLINILRSRPFVADAFLAALVASLAVALALSVPVSGDANLDRPGNAGYWLLVLVPAFAVAFRRRAPIPALVVGVIATMAIWASELPDFTAAACILVYSAVVHGPQPHGRRASIVASIVLTAWTAIGVISGDAPFYVLPVVALFTGTATMVGSHVSTRADFLAEAERRADLAERHQALSEATLLQGERNRIARELHDVIAHGLGVIVVQAGAGRRVLDRDPEAAKQALASIEETGRESLAEMREMLGVLRTNEDRDLRPTPGADAIDELVDGFRASGLPVTITEMGERRALPPMIDTAVYRITQEALTNALKHGGPGVEVSAQFTHGPSTVEVRVLDNGRGGSATPSSSGLGLIGMKERADLCRGSLRSGPRPGGGFEVVAILPRRLKADS